MRLARTFDAVLIHDAIAYMRGEDELGSAFETAAADGVEVAHFEFTWDPDPEDTTVEVVQDGSALSLLVGLRR